MGDNLAELLYMAWRYALLSSTPDLPSWGNVRDPDVRAAWEAAATKARVAVKTSVTLDVMRISDLEVRRGELLAGAAFSMVAKRLRSMA